MQAKEHVLCINILQQRKNAITINTWEKIEKTKFEKWKKDIFDFFDSFIIFKFESKLNFAWVASHLFV